MDAASLLLRLNTLTVIMMGKGLNGVCSTLHQSLGSFGLTANMVGNAIGVLFILYALWLLYFDGTLYSCSPKAHIVS